MSGRRRGTERPPFGQRVRERRREKMKLTQQELADRLGMTRKSVSRWENGHFDPYLISLAKLARALRCDEIWLEKGVGLAEGPQSVEELLMSDEGEKVAPQVAHELRQFRFSSLNPSRAEVLHARAVLEQRHGLK
jgi:transcriptional regulator with XRE-family HTH domain